VFKGQAFISKPSKIVFKDFDLGRTRVQTIQLTNVSFSFNSFKLIPLNEKIRDFFDITYTPPGRMSAGMSCPIRIKFKPEVDEDIFDYFPILSATGEIRIPIECTCKKAIVTALDATIDFGKVIEGEDKTLNFCLTNSGALETDMWLKSLKGVVLHSKEETSSYVSSYKARSMKKGSRKSGTRD
jgi:hypothetical protein